MEPRGFGNKYAIGAWQWIPCTVLVVAVEIRVCGPCTSDGSYALERGRVPALLLLLGHLGLSPVPASCVCRSKAFSCLVRWLMMVALSQGRRATLFLLRTFTAVLLFW